MQELLKDTTAASFIPYGPVGNSRIHSFKYFLPTKAIRGNNDNILRLLLGKAGSNEQKTCEPQNFFHSSSLTCLKNLVNPGFTKERRAATAAGMIRARVFAMAI